MPAPVTEARMKAFLAGAKKAKIKALVYLEACTGCEVCIAVCPVPDCIEKFGEDPTSFGVYVNYDLCIGCLLCAKDCPWDTIKMVKREFTEGHVSSLESQPNHTHSIFENPELVPERVRGFLGKEPAEVPSPRTIEPNPPGK